jgi:putative membrane protein
LLLGCLRDRIPVELGLQADFAKRLREETNFAYRAAMRHFVFRWLVTTVGVMVASNIPGIRYDSAGALIGAALLLGILNAFVRPVLLILGAPLILLTLGIFILIVNGLMLYWVPGIVSGFHVDTYGSAFWGAIVITLISWLLSAFFRGSDGRVHVLTHHTQIKRVQGRVIEPEDKLQ